VIVMSHFLDFSYRQMAQSLDVPIGTVTSRLHAARKALRDKLEGMRP
jgi:DNA-directed RNA polymerase specialized sigma24 family protein